MVYKIGSARSDERGHYTGGKPGDQKQTDLLDNKGEVSIQDFYIHKKGWVILRAKSATHARKLAKRMAMACLNKNIGYSQSDRYGIIKNGTESKVPCNADCSSTVRQCVIEATGTDPGDFNTGSEATALVKTGLFDKIEYKKGAEIYTGDILVTKTKGHTVICTEGEDRISKPSKNYPKYIGTETSIVNALRIVGETDTSLTHRKKIAEVNNIGDYTGTAAQNGKLLQLLKTGKLVKA